MDLQTCIASLLDLFTFIIKLELHFLIIIPAKTMSNTNHDDERFKLQVLDSERARHTPLVNPSYFTSPLALQQNIKINPDPQVQSQTSDLQPSKKSFSILNAGSYNLQKSSHPSICVFTLVLKVASFLIYLILSNFMSNILTFILVLMFSAIDFWVVKNISGRLLVGLRWGSELDMDQKQVWFFEAEQKSGRKSNKVDKLFFWSSQIIFTVIWGLLLLLNVLTLSLFWALLVSLNLGLCGVNLYAYYLCKEKGDREKKKINKQLGKKMFRQVVKTGL